MKHSFAIAGLVAIAQAQYNIAAATDCSALRGLCQAPAADGTSANQAVCASNFAQCQQCQTDANKCKSPGNGVSGNMAGCNAQLMNCVDSAFPALKDQIAALGSSVPSAIPSATGSSATATATSTSSCPSTYAEMVDCKGFYNKCRQPNADGTSANQATCAAANAACKACEDTDASCRVGPDANMATCSAEKAGCVAKAWPQFTCSSSGSSDSSVSSAAPVATASGAATAAAAATTMATSAHTTATKSGAAQSTGAVTNGNTGNATAVVTAGASALGFSLVGAAGVAFGALLI